MTNAEKIIALLSKHPGLDDDEISSHTRIRPRQQVNQICRRLEAKRKIRRVTGPHGKVVNYLVSSEHLGTATSEMCNHAPGTTRDYTASPRPRRETLEAKIDTSALDEVGSLDLKSTLILIPCSGRKIEGGHEAKGPSLGDELTEPLQNELQWARQKAAPLAHVDESAFLPAWQRYTGTLYQSADPALETAIEAGQHILILSGGYGMVLANEPIGHYKRVFKRGDWPNNILGRALLHYIRLHNLKNVVAIVSATTAYRDALREVDWTDTELDSVSIVMPEATTGAQVKTPRAQGEALSALIRGRLSASFRSSDDLQLGVHKIKLK